MDKKTLFYPLQRTLCTKKTNQSRILLMSSFAVISRIRVNPNHFLPKSLIDAPMWYTSSSMNKKRSCALLNRFISISGY